MIDKNENHEEATDEIESSMDELSEHMPASMTIDGGRSANKSDGTLYESKTELDVQNSVLSEVCCAVLENFLLHFHLPVLIYESMETFRQGSPVDELIHAWLLGRILYTYMGE